MDDALRIDLTHPTYWPEVVRGAERVAADLSRGLAAGGHRVRLLTSHAGRPRRSSEAGVRVWRHWRPPDAALRRRGFQAHLTHLPALYVSLRMGGADLVHALSHTDALAAARWSRAADRPSVYTTMGIPSEAWLDAARGRRSAFQAAVGDVAAVVALSEAAAAGLRATTGRTATVIPPGVDLQTFTPGGVRAARPTILCTSAADDPRKRVDLLLGAFALLRRDVPDARLVLDADSARRMPKVLAAAGVDLVRFDDRGPALAAAYRRAWAHVLPSRAEAFGLVALEALACGTPIVASADAGTAELVDGPAIGRLFDGDDPEVLAAALAGAMALHEDPGTVTACRRRAEAFSTARATDAHLALYRRLLG